MDRNKDTPLRLLVKTYTNGLLNRDQYLQVRQQLLRKLSNEGDISHDDLRNFLETYQDSEKTTIWNNYSTSDWVIIILGLIAAATLAVFLYN